MLSTHPSVSRPDNVSQKPPSGAFPSIAFPHCLDILVKWPSFDNVLIPPFFKTVTGGVPQPTRLFSNLKALVTHRGSLTKALQEQLGMTLYAHVHHEQFLPMPNAWKARLAQRREGRWRVRTTSLYITHPKTRAPTPLVFAQSLIPTNRLHRFGTRLLNYPNHPIGNLLFEQTWQPRREWLTVSQLPIYQLPAPLQQWCNRPKQTGPRQSSFHPLWVRQSRLQTQPKPVIITEILLPTLTQLLEKQIQAQQLK